MVKRTETSNKGRIIYCSWLGSLWLWTAYTCSCIAASVPVSLDRHSNKEIPVIPTSEIVIKPPRKSGNVGDVLKSAALENLKHYGTKLIGENQVKSIKAVENSIKNQNLGSISSDSFHYEIKVSPLDLKATQVIRIEEVKMFTDLNPDGLNIGILYNDIKINWRGDSTKIEYNIKW